MKTAWGIIPMSAHNFLIQKTKWGEGIEISMCISYWKFVLLEKPELRNNQVEDRPI